MYVNITHWPVVIFASPRTGSTALGHHLQKLNPHVRLFTEPNFDAHAMRDYLAYSANNSMYIVKLLGSSIPFYPRSIFSDNMFKIKITRRNIVEQVASHYLAMKRNIWSYHTLDSSYADIAIDQDSIKKSIVMIEYDRDIVNQLTADIELVYEDFAQFNSPTHKTPLPANYNKLIDAITEFI